MTFRTEAANSREIAAALDLRHSARVRAFTDYVGGELIKLRKVLEGG